MFPRLRQILPKFTYFFAVFAAILFAAQSAVALDTSNTSNFTETLTNITGNYYMDYHTLYRNTGDYLFLHDVTVSFDAANTANLEWIALCACGSGFDRNNPAAALSSSQCNCGGSTSAAKTWSFDGYKMTDETLVGIAHYEAFPDLAAAVQNPVVASKMFTEYVDGVNDTHTTFVFTTFHFCGDNILDSGEECDGTADDACPGSCSAQCTCPGTSSSSSSSSGGSSSGSSSSGGSSSGSSSSGSSSSGGSSSGSSSSSSSSSGGSSSGGCEFDIDCLPTEFNCTFPTTEIVDGKIAVPLTVSGAECFDKNEVCVEVASTPIVANHGHDIRDAEFSDCLPTSDFEIVGETLFIPAQYKSAYKIRVSKIPTTSEQICFYDTRVQPISGTGANCSRSLASIADNANICSTSYPEARTLMNPRIAQILQPFHEPGECQNFTCANGDVVELCGCDATGDGVVLSSLDALDHSTNYLDFSNTSTDKINGEVAWLSDCASGNVIFFDPPNGGSVTLDAPGDDFVLPPYPVTLVIRGADLRIADNLIYPDGSDASLGVIVLENDVCGATFGGDVFLHPDPTNVVGAYYLEGSVKSTDENWYLPTDRSNVRWYEIFKNQILWEGTILSLNSIGGAVDPIWPNDGYDCPLSDWPREIGGGLVDPIWDRAVELDLAYLREYFHCGNLTSALENYGSQNWKISGCDNSRDEIVHDENGAISADGTDAEEAVVLRYDSRIQNNPPPGFDGVAEIIQSESGL